ncbi:GFA family protein [Algicola sagamiensis]|uniref:GFA family protein n=1 Tax=Algicola sagamiensis TaxID=163869 RepID=UPI0003764ADD|nr:GFA family protein [Algicola sagamiensis]
MPTQVTYPVAGSCQCGQVTYSLKTAPLVIAACHCIDCQKLSASAFSLTLVCQTDQVEFRGQLKQWERLAESGNRNQAFFCPECGNRIYHLNPEQPKLIKLKGGTLSNTDVIQPNVHVWISRKQKWLEIPDGIPTFEQQPPKEVFMKAIQQEETA